MIFDELTKHDSATKFVKYLLSNLLDTRFMIEDIAEKAFEDTKVQTTHHATIGRMK